MTQMIIGGIYLPMSSGDRYACWEEELSTTVEMISGRVVRELRNQGGRFKVWRARNSFDYLEPGVYQPLLQVLRSGKPFSAVVLPDDGSEMVAGTFMATGLTPATFGFRDGGEAVWRGLAFEIREVQPH